MGVYSGRKVFDGVAISASNYSTLDSLMSSASANVSTNWNKQRQQPTLISKIEITHGIFVPDTNGKDKIAMQPS